MSKAESSLPLQLGVGGLSGPELKAALHESRVLLNSAAELLLAHVVFNRQTRECFQAVQCTVRQLGFANGAALCAIFARARVLGLSLCPVITGPYLRLALTDQESAPDSVMSSGTAPSGSITVASAPLDDDDDFPKGFYLRVVKGELWLRGYYTDDQHIWSPDDCFAFRKGGYPAAEHVVDITRCGRSPTSTVCPRTGATRRDAQSR